MNIAVIVSCAVASAILIVIGTILSVRHRRTVLLDEADRWLVNEFRRCNVMVWGKKGSGKDVIFAHVIALRGEYHYANIPYDQNTEVIELHEIAAGDNTPQDCINGTVRPFPPRFKERCDIYVSDAGIYFPNTMNKQLDDLYPSMPVFMALSRHLYELNVHTNCQAFERPYKKIREQADSYIQVLGTVCRGDCLYVRIHGYDSYSNAEKEVNPVVAYTVRVPVGELQYDSRYFRDVFLLREPTARERVMKKTIRRVNYDESRRQAKQMADQGNTPA